MAHRGVLFLDEMPEFSRRSLEILRQPMEDKVIQLSRVQRDLMHFPAGFMLGSSHESLVPAALYPDMNQVPVHSWSGESLPGEDQSVLLLDRLDLCAEAAACSF